MNCYIASLDIYWKRSR